MQVTIDFQRGPHRLMDRVAVPGLHTDRLDDDQVEMINGMIRDPSITGIQITIVKENR